VRQLLKQYFRQRIPLMAWSPSLIDLFQDIKVCITSSPVLARYDPSKPTCLKTDQSAHGMGYILIEPTNDTASIVATAILIKTGECLFDTKNLVYVYNQSTLVPDATLVMRYSTTPSLVRQRVGAG